MIFEEEYGQKIDVIVNKDYKDYLNKFANSILNEASRCINKVAFNLIYDEIKINMINIIKNNISEFEFRIIKNYIYEDYPDYDQFKNSDECTQKSINKRIATNVLEALNIKY